MSRTIPYDNDMKITSSALNLSTRLAFGYVTVIATLLLVLGVTFGAFHVARLENSQVHDNYIPSLDASKIMLVRLERMRDAELLALTPGQNATRWLRTFDHNAAEFEQYFEKAGRLVSSPEEQLLYAQLGQQHGAFMHIHGRLRHLITKGRLAQAQELNATEALAQGERLRLTARGYYDFNMQETILAREMEERVLFWTESAALLIAGCGAGLAGLMWRRASQEIVAPLRTLQAATGAIAHGEFQEVSHPAAARTVELAALQDDFNRMAGRLRVVTRDLHAVNATLENQVDERTRALQAANTRLESMLEELRTLDQLKSNFMAIMSHELLTPINFITGFGSALEDELLGPLTADQHRTICKILEGADRLTRMVRNTLDYTQLESGRMSVISEAVDLTSLVGEVVESTRPRAEARRQTLELLAPAELPDAWADPSRVAQVLSELLDNAIRFSPEGRKVRVSVTAAPDALVLEVADTGDGIPAEAFRDLFKPFYQVDFSSTRRHGGMGLGLAIAYRLVQAMGGQMQVVSRLGQGATFQFTLLRADHKAQNVPGASQQNVGPNG